MPNDVSGYRGLVTGCGTWAGWFCGAKVRFFEVWNYGVIELWRMRLYEDAMDIETGLMRTVILKKSIFLHYRG